MKHFITSIVIFLSLCISVQAVERQDFYLGATLSYIRPFHIDIISSLCCCTLNPEPIEQSGKGFSVGAGLEYYLGSIGGTS